MGVGRLCAGGMERRGLAGCAFTATAAWHGASQYHCESPRATTRRQGPCEEPAGTCLSEMVVPRGAGNAHAAAACAQGWPKFAAVGRRAAAARRAVRPRTGVRDRRRGDGPPTAGRHGPTLPTPSPHQSRPPLPRHAHKTRSTVPFQRIPSLPTPPVPSAAAVCPRRRASAPTPPPRARRRTSDPSPEPPAPRAARQDVARGGVRPHDHGVQSGGPAVPDWCVGTSQRVGVGAHEAEGGGITEGAPLTLCSPYVRG